MKYTTLSTPEFVDENSIVTALIEALKNGDDGIRLRVGRDMFRYIEVPDKNELSVLRDVVDEFQRLKAAGTSLQIDGSEEKAIKYAEQLLEISQWANTTDVREVQKDRREVKNEILTAIFLNWEHLLEECSEENAPFFSLPRYDVQTMSQVFQNAVNGGLIDRSTPENDFLYYFGLGSTDELPSGQLKWRAMIPDLVTFIDYLVADYYWAKKTAQIFLVYSQTDNEYRPVSSRTLSTSLNREGGRIYKEGKDRQENIYKCIFPKDDEV